jgi:hypothetical protein
MTEPLVAEVRRILEAGRGEQAGDRPFVPVLLFDSGARYGIDAQGQWVASLPASSQSGDPATGVYTAESDAHAFYEALEEPRNAFEARLEEGARAAGLPPDQVVLSFPAVQVVRAVVARQSAYLIRLALLWIHPTELREMRPDLVRLAESPHLPTHVKDLARRLIVPES